MNLDLNDEQKLIQETTRLVANNELAQVSSLSEQALEQQALIANLNKLAALGFMGINVEQRYGGAEAGVIAFSVAMTEIARVCASTAISVSINNLACEIIQAIGTEAQKQDHIPKDLPRRIFRRGHRVERALCPGVRTMYHCNKSGGPLCAQR